MPSARRPLSRSATRPSRKALSASARATIVSSSRRARGNSCAACTQSAGAGGSIPMSRESRSMSYAFITSPALRTARGRRFFPVVPQFRQAAGDSARDRAGGKLECVADRPIALVPREEAVEDFLAVLGQRRERLVDVERLL